MTEPLARGPAGAMTAGAGEPVTRLHPLSPVLRSAKLIALMIAAVSWQGYSQLGFATWLGLITVLLLGALGLSVVSWWFTGYHVVGRELRVYEGLLWRRTRAIPLERLQAIDVVRPPLAKLAGLAELSLQVVGAGKAEAPLAYLPMDNAVALRDRLLRLSSRTADVADAAVEAAPAGGAPVATEAAPRPLHAVANRDVVVSQLLTPQVWFIPFGFVFVVVQFLNDRPGWTFVGVASVITAIVGVLQHPVRRVLQDWHFRVATTPAGLRLSGGLLETRIQTVAPHRIQAIGITWPLLWRPQQWLRARIDVAGYGAQPNGQGAAQVSRLLPVGDFATTRRLVAEVLPGVDLGALPFRPAPRRARWVAPIGQPVLATALTDEVLATTNGRLTRELVVVPYARIQSVRVTQGPVQRRLGLATVHADAAGSLHAVAEHRDEAEAWVIAAELAERARLARARSGSAAI
jgi:putative membrane protein